MKEKKMQMNEAVTAKIVDSLQKRNLSRAWSETMEKRGISSRDADGFCFGRGKLTERYMNQKIRSSEPKQEKKEVSTK